MSLRIIYALVPNVVFRQQFAMCKTSHAVCLAFSRHYLQAEIEPWPMLYLMWVSAVFYILDKCEYGAI
ncbi:hypothetical protein DD595_25135 [Enterobacter cloacae complex sp. 4DZ3-17B2]|nr:hypothetical protein DD595_25135 [Enterobacter cloacae complex sp. 4DZ3-17B2]